MNTAASQDLSARDRSASSPPVYGSMEGFAPCPLVTPNPAGSTRALSAVRPRGPSVPRSPAATATPPEWSPRTRSRSGSPGRTFTFPGSVDLTFDPRVPEGPAVYAQPVHDQLYAPEYSKLVVTGPYGKPLDVMEMFPTLFTAFCFGTFVTPIILCYHIGRDPQVLFWIGDYINWVVFLPILYVWAHIYHSIFRLPSKFVMVLCLIGSCIVILVLSEHVLLDAYDRANEFTARDCDTFPRKRELQVSWEAARTFYANCMASMADELDIGYESVVNTYRIEDCGDYAAQLDQNPDWEYLAELEEEHLCAGWCERGHAIWTLAETRDSCSATVADIMINKVRWTMLQVVVYTIFLLGVVSVMFVALGPSLWRHNDRRAAYV